MLLFLLPLQTGGGNKGISEASLLYVSVRIKTDENLHSAQFLMLFASPFFSALVLSKKQKHLGAVLNIIEPSVLCENNIHI